MGQANETSEARGARRRWGLSVERRVVLAFTVSALLSVALVTAMLYIGLREAAQKDLVVEQEHFAVALGDMLDRELRQAQRQLQHLARDPAVAGLPALARVNPALNGIPEGADPAKRRAFDDFLALFPSFSVLFVLQPNGDHYLSHPYEVQQRLERFNLAERAYFRQATRTRRPVISDSFVGADGVPAVAIDVPLLDRAGGLMGHLGGVFHLTDLSAYVAPERIGPYNAGFLLDSRKLLIAHTDPAQLYDALGHRAGAPPLVAAMGAAAPDPDTPGASVTQIYEDPVDGKSYLGTLVSLRGGWCFGLTREMDELEQAIIARTARFAGLVGVLMLIVGGIGLAVANALGARWHQAEAALRRAHDEMEDQVRQRSADLIATNEALQREVRQRERAEAELRGHHHHLEELVAKRTAALSESHERLEAEVAQRRQVETELREREAHLRHVLNSAPIVLWTADRDGIVTLSEGSGLAARGRKPGQIVGMSMFDVYLDRPEVVANIRRALSGETVRYRVEIGDHWYESVYTPLRGEGGEIEGLLGVSTDVTERVIAEEALRESQASLALAQRIAKLGSWDWDVRANRMQWSAELVRLLGGPSEAPAYAAYLKRVHPADREAVKDAVAAALGRGAGFMLEHRLRPDAGPERWIELRGDVVCDEEGTVTRMIVTAHDITERRETRDALAHTARQLDVHSGSLEEFGYLISHDLKQPLAVAESAARALEAQETPGGARDAAGRILDATRHMGAVIDGMLALVRVTAQAQPRVPVELEDVARAVLQDLATLIAESGAEVSVHDLPGVHADPTQMRQLLRNLVANALKFHRPGEPPRVYLQGMVVPDTGAGVARFLVEDEGVGIAFEEAPHLFQPFRRGRNAGAVEGSGIGLAICQRIVDHHGGAIRAEARPGGGTRFVVELPAAPMGLPAVERSSGGATTPDRPA